ncbi:hypothetical protein KNV09_gp178 [Vibrio phage Athena]|uniref:Uncharacterized protein n=4 Tax=Thalassavirus TaxID=2948922 RepID=A0A6M9Z1N7_9CAUD|nr:hypothetical protein KNU88_gp176 [Vibrio phage Chester]YP_010108344.1 hypothetical protein KNV07_gp178 [Vibrio phage Cody]YP_010108538.1 hypothetical protein KNV08_gp182 [Vibrio phage Quinn]YP_010108732.1 hypothetical protein KNV09_gp178 [Vibrio phage Athena]QIG66231.1 hypothetical protein CILSICK_128 [Vibrio phage Cilsick]WBU77113.1 hypothetical protein NOELLE_125 [Vibrio phage Noelle]WCD55802.1 hypothetical protein ROCKET24_125 [Vibrio phage Rocket24]QIN96537.1 hypothetical protein CHES
MSKALFDLVTELRSKDIEAHELAEQYLKDFDTMLLVEPIKALCSETLEANYRGRMHLYFGTEFNQHMAFPEYRSTYLKEYGIEGIDYESGCIHLESWCGDSCDTLLVPVMDFNKLREVQEVALGMVTTLNILFHKRKSEKEDADKEARRKKYLELQKEFGNE